MYIRYKKNLPKINPEGFCGLLLNFSFFGSYCLKSVVTKQTMPTAFTLRRCICEFSKFLVIAQHSTALAIQRFSSSLPHKKNLPKITPEGFCGLSINHCLNSMSYSTIFIGFSLSTRSIQQLQPFNGFSHSTAFGLCLS